MEEQKDKESPSASIPARLWLLAGKIRGIGEILGMAQADAALSDDAIHGLSHLLIDFAKELDQMREILDNN